MVGSVAPGPSASADEVDDWARERSRVWDREALARSLTMLAEDDRTGPETRAVAITWLLATDDTWLDRSLACADAGESSGMSHDTLASLWSVAARQLGRRDDPRAAAALASAHRHAAEATTAIARVAPFRTEVELALGGEPTVLAGAVERMTAAAEREPTADDEEPGTVVLTLRLLAAGVLATGLDRSDDEATIGELRARAERLAGTVDGPDAAVTSALAAAANLGLRLRDGLWARSMAEAAQAAAGDAIPPAHGTALQLLAADGAALAGDRDAASAAHDRAVALARADGAAPLVADALVSRARHHNQRHRDGAGVADDDFRAAFDLLVADDRPTEAIALACEQGLAALDRGELEVAIEARDRARQTLAAGPAPSEEGPRAAAALTASTIDRLDAGIADHAGDLDAAAEAWNRVLVTLTGLGLPTIAERAEAGVAAQWAGDSARAESLFREASKELDRWHGELPEAVHALQEAELTSRRSNWHLANGRREEGLADARRAVAARRRVADPIDLARALQSLAGVEQRRDPRAALDAVEEAILLYRSAGLAGSEPPRAAAHLEAARLLDGLGRAAEAELHRDQERSGEGPTAEVDGDPLVSLLERVQAVRSGDLERAELLGLATDPEVSIRAAVAARPGLPDDVARILLRDRDAEVREVVATNPEVPLALIGPARRRWRAVPAVRRAAAARPDATPALLSRLGDRMQRWDVRRAVAANPASPPQVLRALSGAPSTIRTALAANPSAPNDLLATMAGAEPDMVRFEAAGNPSTPGEALRRLLTDRSVWVQGRAAANPSTPPDALRSRMAKMDQPAWVLRAAATNPACPPDLADQLLTWLALGGAEGDAEFDPVACTGNPGPAGTDAVQWYRAEGRRSRSQDIEHALWRVRVDWVRGRRTLPGRTVEAVSRDPNPEVRRAALDFGLPKIHLDELIHDADPTVRQLAERRLVQERERLRRTRFRRGLARVEFGVRSCLGRLLIWAFPVVMILALAAAALGGPDDQAPPGPAIEDLRGPGSIEESVISRPPGEDPTIPAEAGAVAGLGDGARAMVDPLEAGDRTVVLRILTSSATILVDEVSMIVSVDGRTATIPLLEGERIGPWTTATYELERPPSDGPAELRLRSAAGTVSLTIGEMP